MPLPEHLPRDVRPQRLPPEQIVKLARRVVYFPYDYDSTAGRHYKGDVKAALGHGLAIELEHDAEERRHAEETAALREEIAALTARIEQSQQATSAPRVSEADDSDVAAARVMDADPAAGMSGAQHNEASENASEGASEDARTAGDDAATPNGGTTR